jgi:hypothetical protein
MSRYIYSLIRFVPDAATGEFINIGAIAGSEDEADWDVRTVSNQKRASYFDSAGVLSKVIARVSEIQGEVAREQQAVEDGKNPSLSESWLFALHEQHRRILQFSTPTPMIAESSEEALETIFDELVRDPASSRLHWRTKRAPHFALLRAYRAVGLKGGKTVRQDSVVNSIHHTTKFDFVIGNGSAVQLAQAWSFEAPNSEQLATEVKAWAWAVQDLRNTGGSVRSEGETLSVPRDVDIEVVYLPPKTPEGQRVFEEAESAFKEVRARPRQESEVTAIAREAADSLASAHG